MEEKELFEEIKALKALIEEYKEYANQETPEVFKWNDSRASSVSKVQDRNYTTDREGEILEILDEERTINSRRLLIEELVQIREAKKREMRSTIFEKSSALISDSKEKVNQAIEEKRQELEEKKEEKRIKLEEKQQELEEKKQQRRDMNKRSKALVQYLQLIEKDLGKNDKVYMAVGEEKLQATREKEDLSRDINALEKECETLKIEYEDFIIENDEELKELVNTLNEFDEIYDKMNSENEEVIANIEEMVVNHIEDSEISTNNEIPRLTEDEVEVEAPPKIITMDDIRREQIKEEEKAWELYYEEDKQQQEEWKKQQDVEWEKYFKIQERNKKMPKRQVLKKKLGEVFAQIEKDNEDLILPNYIKFKEDLEEKKDIEKVIKALEGKTLLDIYKKQLVHMDENSKTRKELEAIIEELKARQERPEGTKPEQKPKPESNGRDENITNPKSVRELEERKALQEELMEMLAEIKKGNEDIVHPKYLRFEENLMEREDLEEVIKTLKGKTLIDIYNSQIIHMKEGSKTRKELEAIIEELKARQEKKEETKPEGTKPEGTKPQGAKPEGTKPQGTKPEGTKPQGAKPEGTKPQGTKPEGTKPEGTKPKETIDNEEQLSHQELLEAINEKIMEWENGNEDLLLPIYFDYIDFYIKGSNEDYDYAKRILGYLERTNLLGFYKDALDTIMKEKQPSEEDIRNISDIKDVIAKLAARDKHRIKSTTIVVEPYKDLIKINIKGREKTIGLNNILGLVGKGKELQEGELISKFGVNRCNPVILAALTEIGEKYPIHKDLIDEYISTFSEAKTDKIDDIIYYFNEGENNKADNYKKIVSACKKYAKADAKYGIATIEKSGKEKLSKEGIWARIQNFFTNRKQKRLESKEAKEYRTSRLKRFKEKNGDIETPVKKRNPREAFMKKINVKGKKQAGEMDMSEAIKKLESVNQKVRECQALNQEIKKKLDDKEEEEVL